MTVLVNVFDESHCNKIYARREKQMQAVFQCIVELFWVAHAMCFYVISDKIKSNTSCDLIHNPGFIPFAQCAYQYASKMPELCYSNVRFGVVLGNYTVLFLCYCAVWAVSCGNSVFPVLQDYFR